MLNKRIVAIVLSFVLLFGCLSLAPTSVLQVANAASKALLQLDFNTSTPASSILVNPNSSLLTFSNGDFATDSKSNATGAVASGGYALLEATSGTTVSALSVKPTTTLASAANSAINSLTAGVYDLRVAFDYDLVNRNDVRSPFVFLRMYGKNAVTGTTNTSFIPVSVYANSSSTAVLGDNMFEHYEMTVPIKLFNIVNSSNDDGNGKSDEFIVGTFTQVDFQLVMYSGSGANSLALALDNITVDATLTTAPTPTATAAYVGENRTIKGNWIGSYGSEGYVLPYYASTLSSGRDNPLANHVASLPSYVSGYTMYGSTYWMQQNPTSDARALRSPDGTTRKQLNVYGNSIETTFTLTDTSNHLLTMYTTDFGSSDTVIEKIELFDLQGQLLDSRVISSIQDGLYVMFQVSGSFKVKTTKLAGYATSVEGYFFDALPANQTSSLNATYVAPRMANLNWTNSGSPQQSVQIERKTVTDVTYAVIATVSGSVYNFTDTNLTDGVDYTYRVRTVSGSKLSLPSNSVDVAIPAYNNSTTLTFGASSYAVSKPGDGVLLEAILKDSSNNPVVGASVNFNLAGTYVGTYILPEIGTVLTDTNGKASIDYYPAYGGEYQVQAKYAYDDVHMYKSSMTTVGLRVSEEAWQKPPVILRVSDAVYGNSLLSVNGYGMKAADMANVVVKVKAVTGIAMNEPPAGATELAIEQTDERNGYYITARMDDTLPGGVYDLWVGNEYGWSAPVQLNGPRPLFISEYEAYEGLDIEMSGRNLAGAEFGADNQTLIRLNDGSNTYNQEIKQLTPYSVLFTIGSLPLGTYDVEVSNDNGVTWARLNNSQQLTVIEVSSNPLGLNAAWVSSLNWSNTFNVTSYGATGNDSSDDTTAVSNAVYAANQAGGGVVYFPAGSYYLQYVDLPADIVLLGESTVTTVVYHNGTKANFIRSYGDGKTVGRQGVARMTLKLANPDVRPDSFIWFGHDWGSAVVDQTLRTASDFFIYQVNIDYPMTPQPSGSGRGMAALFIAKERVLFEQNHLKGYYAISETAYINKYTSHRNNEIEYATGRLSTFAMYAFMENNHLVSHPEFGEDSHGLFAKGNSHLYNNVVENSGATSPNNNDGEALAVEMPGGSLSEGPVLGATASSITVAPKIPLQTSYPLRISYLAVVIVDGKGLGQIREVTGLSGNMMTVSKNWDVIPDSSSKFTLIAPNDNVTFYKNTVLNAGKGIWFYGNAIDGVIADNKVIDSEGIYVYTSQVSAQSRLTPDHFITVRGNAVSGVSRRSGHAGIYVNSQRNGVEGKYYAVSAYGIDVKDNIIVGDLSAEPVLNTEAPNVSGLVSWSATLGADVTPVPGSGDNTNVVMENNRLVNLKAGIHLSMGDYGHVVKGNSFDGVTNQYEYRGNADNLSITTDAFSDRRAAYWAAGSTLSADYDGSDVILTWDEADDNVAVDNYQIFLGDTLIDTIPSSVLSYRITGLTLGQSYRFCIKAGDAAGNPSTDALLIDLTYAP